MKTDQSDSIRESRRTLNQINVEIPAFPIGSEPRQILEQTAIALESLIWELVHEDLIDISGKLKRHQSELQVLGQEMHSKVTSLEKITKMLENISQMIGKLASLAALVLGIFIL